MYHYIGLRQAQDANFIFHQSGSDAIILHDNVPANVLDKVVTFAGEVLFERTSLPPPPSPLLLPSSSPPRPLTKPEATPGDRIDLHISGQPEEPYRLNEKRAKVFIISSLVKQFLKYYNVSTMINDLIKDYSQRNTAQVDYYPVPHRYSENHEPQNGNLERHEVLRS